MVEQEASFEQCLTMYSKVGLQLLLNARSARAAG